MSTKLDKRSYLKTLRTQFYDKNNFNMITKLIGTSIKGTYNFNLNKKDKEFILNTMKNIYDENKQEINKSLELKENLQLLNKNILNIALKELNSYYNDKQESINIKHKIIDRPISTVSSNNSINNDFEKLVIKRSNNEKREELNFDDKEHNNSFKLNNHNTQNNVLDHDNSVNSNSIFNSSNSSNSNDNSNDSNDSNDNSLDSQFMNTSITQKDEYFNKYYNNEKVNVEDKLKEVLNSRNDVIQPLNNPSSKTIEQSIKENHLDSIKEEASDASEENNIIEKNNMAPKMPSNIVENTNNYASINNIDENNNITKELKEINTDVIEDKEDTSSELMKELYNNLNENNDDNYMEINDLLTIETQENQVQPINNELTFEYTKMHEELREKHSVNQQHINQQLQEIEKNIISASSNNVNSQQTINISSNLDSKIDILVNIQEKIENNMSNYEKFSDENINNNIKSFNNDISQKISFINNTITSKIEDNEIYQHKVTQNLENQLSNTKVMYEHLTDLLNTHFEKIDQKLQTYNNETQIDNYKILLNTFELDYNLLNNFNFSFKTKRNSSKINFDLKFIHLPKSIIINECYNQIIKLEVNLLNSNKLLESKTVFSKIRTNSGQDYYLLENLYYDILSFTNTSNFNEFTINVKIKDIFDDLYPFEIDYYNIISVSPINLDQNNKKVKLSEIDNNTIIKKASLISFDKEHKLENNTKILFKQFTITPNESLEKLLNIHNILKINDNRTIIIDLDTRNFNFDKLGKLYANNLKGAICFDIKESY